MPRFLLTVCFMLMASGCGGPRYVDYFPYHDDGSAKPRIAFVGVIDISDSQYGNLSEEFAQGVRYWSMHNGILYLLSEREINPDLRKSGNINLFCSDLSFVKKFAPADFVVGLELIEYQTQPSCQAHPGKLLLTIKLRIKIIDIREEQPYVILQEIIKSKHVIAGEEEHTVDVYRLANQRLICEIVRRIEDVTCIAR